MKKTHLLVLLVLVSLTAGCDTRLGYQQTQETFPSGDVKALPDSRHLFLVKTTNGDIYYVKSDGINVYTNLMFRGR